MVMEEAACSSQLSLLSSKSTEIRDLLHSALEIDQILLLEAELLTEEVSENEKPKLENIKEMTIQNAKLLRQIQQKLQEVK